jgi:ABC-type multidrug transport system fused ATPase/permease subunit
MKNIKLIIALLNRREKRQLILILFALLVMGFIELIGVGSISPFISVLSNPGIIHTNEYFRLIYDYFHFESANGFIIAFGIGVIIVLALSNLCIAFTTFIINIYSGKRWHSISMRLLEKYLRQPYVFYLGINTADLSKKILNEIQTFVQRVLAVLLQLISGSVISLSIVILLLIINPLLAVITSTTLGLLYIVLFSFIRNFITRKGAERNINNSLRYKYINEIFGGIKDVKIFGKEKVFLDFFSQPSKNFVMNDVIIDVINELPKYLLETIAFSGIILVVVIMIASGIQIETFLPVLTVYAFGAYRLLPTLQKIFRAIASMKYSFPMVVNLYQDFKELPEGTLLTDNPAATIDFNRTIFLNNISYSYPNSDKIIIKNQTLKIESNTSIAIVGSTGCGKTTLADIILGLLEPQEGKIYIDDVEINNTNKRSWQKKLGYVPQSIYLTDDTIRNNIAFGLRPEEIEEDKIITAAKIASIHDFVSQELPEQYNTLIGERGIRLSGGQRQRIGIARAVYHDPSVFILDEATSALDSLTENAIMDAIKYLSHKKTIIMIAHRITTVKNCDIIYLMEKGTIVDHGAYDELYLKNESFKKMADGT